MLNWNDYSIIAILVLSVIISLIRGFVREVISLLTWIAAFWVAFHFSSAFTPVVAKYISTKSIQTPVAFAILFIATLIAGAIFNYVVGLFVDKTGLSGTDRMLGMVFGVARGVLLIAALLLAGSLLTKMPEMSWWKESRLIPHFKAIESWIHGFLPESFNKQFEQAKTLVTTHSALSGNKPADKPSEPVPKAQ
jgi:membrane protein required for colicin V production